MFTATPVWDLFQPKNRSQAFMCWEDWLAPEGNVPSSNFSIGIIWITVYRRFYAHDSLQPILISFPERFAPLQGVRTQQLVINNDWGEDLYRTLEIVERGRAGGIVCLYRTFSHRSSPYVHNLSMWFHRRRPCSLKKLSETRTIHPEDFSQIFCRLSIAWAWFEKITSKIVVSVHHGDICSDVVSNSWVGTAPWGCTKSTQKTRKNEIFISALRMFQLYGFVRAFFSLELLSLL